MKIDRLVGILSVLLQKDKTTSAELSERFEVSRRTIVRDIETLWAKQLMIVISISLSAVSIFIFPLSKITAIPSVLSSRI